MTTRRISLASLVRLLGAWRASRERGAAYRQLADALRLVILDGRLPLSVRLPGERELAQVLDVSRTTVSAAFALLRDEGYLASRQGSGSLTSLPEGPGQRGGGGLVHDPRPGVIGLTAAAMPATEAVHRAYAQAITALPAYLPRHGYEPVGLPGLRAAIAERYTRRGLPTSPQQVLVTHGAQHAFTLALGLLIGPGDRVLIDHPTYPHAIDAILRARGVPLPVGLPPGGGWDGEDLANALRRHAPKLAYLIPDFHNPTGRCMDAEARAEVIAAARRTGTALVFDEALVDLWLDAPPPAPDPAEPAGVVLRLGSMGKTFWGGIRVGWIRADIPMIDALASLRASLDLGTPVLEQLASAILIGEDDSGAEARRAMLRVNRRQMLDLVADHLPDWRTSSPPGGLSLWAELPAPLSTALAAASERHGVLIAAGPRFGVDGAFDRFVRLPYTLPQPDLEAAITRLAKAYAALRPGTGPIAPRALEPGAFV
jgi:DNA-binding transcriptional MocR family regulator